MKITKSNLQKIISWSSTKYNDWLGYGTKKQAVELAYKTLKDGVKIVEIQSASPVGENPHRGNKKYWKTSQSGSKYIVDGVNKTVTNFYSKEVIQFI